MARLFDKAVAWSPKTGRNAESFLHLREGLRDFATPLVCDDAIRRCPNDVAWETLSAVRVPFPVTLIEWRNTDGIEIGVVAFEVDPATVAGSADGAAATIVMRGISARRKSEKVLAWPVGADVDVDDVGNVLERRLAPQPGRQFSDAELITLIGEGEGIYSSAAWMLALANARNITVEEVVPPAPLSKKWKAKTGNGLATYSRIMLPHTAGRPAGSGGGGAQPLELIKGHLKTYDKNPLFGKIRGTWWWEPHVRGDATVGVRTHDYAFGDQAPKPG